MINSCDILQRILKIIFFLKKKFHGSVDTEKANLKSNCPKRSEGHLRSGFNQSVRTRDQ
jgi:hypothetical protein